MDNEFSLFYYSAFGFQLDSDMAFPSLESLAQTPADITIRFSEKVEMGEPLVFENSFFQVSESCLLLKLPNNIRILIEKGNTIHYNQRNAEIAVFILGSAMGALLLQRKVMPLHATCLQHGKTALCIAGISGAGKSTLSAYLNQQGMNLLADDVTALRFIDNLPYAVPGIPVFKLWHDALRYLKFPTELPRIRQEMQKFYFPSPSVVSTPLRLEKIFVLHVSNLEKLSIREITGTEKFNLLRKHTYRQQYLNPMGLNQWHFDECLKLAATTQVFKVSRPRAHFNLAELAEMILTEELHVC